MPVPRTSLPDPAALPRTAPARRPAEDTRVPPGSPPVPRGGGGRAAAPGRGARARGAACPGPEAGPGRSTAGGPLAVPHPACAPAASTAARGAAADPVSAAARWAAFGCVLVPVVLVVYGASAGGVFWVAAVLAAVTGLCRLLLRRSERGAAGVDGPAGGHPA